MTVEGPPVTAMMERQERWRRYLTPEETPTYGTYEDRVQEYRVAADRLFAAGLVDDQMVVDVGAGSCDLDHWLRVGMGWRGQYLPMDGSVQGVDLNVWRPSFMADWFVALETIEHVWEPARLVEVMRKYARCGVVVTTPNPATHEVRATDPTHVSPVSRAELEAWGFTVETVEFNGRGWKGEGDTLIGVATNY